MKNFSLKVKDKRLQRCLEDARKASYSLSAPHNAASFIGDPAEAKGKRLQRCLEDARKASYSLEAAMPQCKVYGVNECKVYGVKCKGEGNNPTPSYTTLHHPTQREAMRREAIVVIILCQDLATANRALDIIQRDLGSQLLQVEQCDTVVGAYLSTLQGFNPSECLSFYHYHLDRSLGHQAQVWITTKGGKL